MESFLYAAAVQSTRQRSKLQQDKIFDANHESSSYPRLEHL